MAYKIAVPYLSGSWIRYPSVSAVFRMEETSHAKSYAFSRCICIGRFAVGRRPNIGTWKLNVAKSKEPDMKELTLAKQELGNGMFELVETGILKDGTKLSGKFTHPQQGGLVTSQSSKPVEGELTVVTIITPADFYVTTLQKGKQVQVQHVVVHQDGKSMSITTKGTDAKGKPFETVGLYDKE
jgi:hypothetical protein